MRIHLNQYSNNWKTYQINELDFLTFTGPVQGNPFTTNNQGQYKINMNRINFNLNTEKEFINQMVIVYV